ncbi:hypothetical protein [Paenibacillus taichungensis]
MNIKGKFNASMYVDIYHDSFFHIDSSFEEIENCKEDSQIDSQFQGFAEDVFKHSLIVIFFTVATLEATLFSYENTIDQPIEYESNIGAFNKWNKIIEAKTQKNNPISHNLKRKVKNLIRLRNEIVHFQPLEDQIDILSIFKLIKDLRNEAITAAKTTEAFLLEIQNLDKESEIINEVLEKISYWKKNMITGYK